MKKAQSKPKVEPEKRDVGRPKTIDGKGKTIAIRLGDSLYGRLEAWRRQQDRIAPISEAIRIVLDKNLPTIE
jgi:hypothetical protein